MEIIRNPNKDDLDRPDFDPVLLNEKGFQPIEDTSGLVRTPADLFAEKLAMETFKAQKKGLPFAEVAARADYLDKVDSWNKEFKRQGYATKKKPTFDEIDWNKYCDLKNFELLEEGTTRDPTMSKEHKVAVYLKWKKYKYKGFKNTFTIMEDPEVALTRALDSLESRTVRKEK